MEMGFFRRIEEKYYLTKDEYSKILKRINDYFIPDSHGFSTICNLYFDTDNYDLVIKSNEKPLYKEKVRLRSYNLPTPDSEVFLEIKKKYDGVVSKRRVSMKLSDFYNYYYNKKSNINTQIMKEIDYTFNYYNLKPKVYLEYNRLAYYCKDNKEFRLTFDFDIKYRLKELDFSKKYNNLPLLDEEYFIMEVKTLDSLPIWFTSILSELKIYSCSFSKYGEVYRRKVKNV